MCWGMNSQWIKTRCTCCNRPMLYAPGMGVPCCSHQCATVIGALESAPLDAFVAAVIAASEGK